VLVCTDNHRERHRYPAGEHHHNKPGRYVRPVTTLTSSVDEWDARTGTHYAYMLIPTEDGLTDIAKRRLAAIREFSDLGAGFRIRRPIWELRGAGNLLEASKSGHIDAIGFDLVYADASTHSG